MKYSVPALLTTVFLFMSVAFISAQDRVCYTGTELSNPYRHDGQLSPAVGVHNIQLLRANRDSITATYNFGWTYNHQPMMCSFPLRQYRRTHSSVAHGTHDFARRVSLEFSRNFVSGI